MEILKARKVFLKINASFLIKRFIFQFPQGETPTNIPTATQDQGYRDARRRCKNRASRPGGPPAY